MTTRLLMVGLTLVLSTQAAVTMAEYRETMNPNGLTRDASSDYGLVDDNAQRNQSDRPPPFHLIPSLRKKSANRRLVGACSFGLTLLPYAGIIRQVQRVSSSIHCSLSSTFLSSPSKIVCGIWSVLPYPSGISPPTSPICFRSVLR